MIVSSINVENVSTSFITTQFMEYKSDSLGGIIFTINNDSATALGILDNSYDFSIFNIANTNINLTAPNIKIDGELDLLNNSIKNVNTITTEYISSSSGVVTLSNSDFIPSVDDAYNLGSATYRWRELYIAGTSIHLGNSLVLSEDSSGRLSTNKIIFTPGLDLDNEAITNVLQTQTVNSAATNATIPQTLFYPINDTMFSNTYVQIQANPPSPTMIFNNLANFEYFKVTCSLSGIGVDLPISLYFQLVADTKDGPLVFTGQLVNSVTPYYSIPNTFTTDTHNFSYIDRYNLLTLPDSSEFWPLLWVKKSGAADKFTGGNIFLTIEPIQAYPYT
jgi:hypothetical protein